MFPNWKTLFLLLPCALAAGVGVYLIYVDSFGTPTTDLGKPVGKIVGVVSDVHRKAASSYLWTRATDQTLIYLNDAIKTGSGGHATLEFPDGSKVEIGEDAMLLIDENLIHGEKAAPAKALTAERPVATLVKPPVVAAASPKPAPVAPRSLPPSAPRLVAKAPPRATRPEPVYSPPPAPATPSPNRLSERVLTLETPSPNERIRYPAGQPTAFLFSWENEPAVTAESYFYSLELSQDYYFTSPLARLRTRENNVSSQRMNIPSGAYYWRVRVVDSSDRVARQSAVQRFTYGPSRPPRQIAVVPQIPATPPPDAPANRGLSAPTHIRVHIE